MSCKANIVCRSCFRVVDCSFAGRVDETGGPSTARGVLVSGALSETQADGRSQCRMKRFWQRIIGVRGWSVYNFLATVTNPWSRPSFVKISCANGLSHFLPVLLPLLSDMPTTPSNLSLSLSFSLFSPFSLPTIRHSVSLPALPSPFSSAPSSILSRIHTLPRPPNQTPSFQLLRSRFPRSPKAKFHPHLNLASPPSLAGRAFTSTNSSFSKRGLIRLEGGKIWGEVKRIDGDSAGSG